MTQLSNPVDPFGEVNVYPQPSGSLDVVATVLMEPAVEGARCGIALDGSSSMKKMYGVNSVISPIFKAAGGAGNVIEPIARTMAGYLANFSSSSRVNLVYWGCGPDGGGIEEIAEPDEQQAAGLTVSGPLRLGWGRKTRLLPAVHHFVEGVFRQANWAICVFVTDGIIEDLPEVKLYCMQYARQVASGKRNPCKLVLIGVGEEVDEGQMNELDDMFLGCELRDPRGAPIALWDHKMAREMRHLAEVFADVVSENAIVADHGTVRDSDGVVVKDYSEGLPALLKFTLPKGSTSFTLELPGHRIVQDLAPALAAAR